MLNDLHVLTDISSGGCELKHNSVINCEKHDEYLIKKTKYRIITRKLATSLTTTNRLHIRT